MQISKKLLPLNPGIVVRKHGQLVQTLAGNCFRAAISTRGNQSRQEDEEETPPAGGGEGEAGMGEVLVGSTRSPRLKNKWAVILSSSRL